MKHFPQKPPLGIPLNRSHPLAKGLVGLWLMNEGTGPKVNDLSGNGNTGSLVADTHFVPGKFGPALDFDGTGDYVNVPGIEDPKFQNMTFSCWVKSDLVDDAGHGVMGWTESADKDRLAIFQRGTDNSYSVLFDSGDTAAVILKMTDAVVGQWFCLAFTMDRNGDLIAYVNGVQTNAVSIAAAAAESLEPDYDFAFGTYRAAGGAPANFFYGQIDHGMIYNRALSAQEIQQLYLDTFAMFGRDDLALWSAAGGVAVKVYTRGDVAAMPADDTDLENAFTDGEYTSVEADDADRVAQTATDEFSAFLFKNKHTGQAAIDVTWNGQSDRAPSDSTVYLQIYNRITPAWETLDSDDATAADTDFDLEGSVAADLEEYFDEDNWIACRIYQEAV